MERSHNVCSLTFTPGFPYSYQSNQNFVSKNVLLAFLQLRPIIGGTCLLNTLATSLHKWKLTKSKHCLAEQTRNKYRKMAVLKNEVYIYSYAILLHFYFSFIFIVC